MKKNTIETMFVVLDSGKIVFALSDGVENADDMFNSCIVMQDMQL